MSDWHNHLKHLEEKYLNLKKHIDQVEASGVYEDEQLSEMKKKRLFLKDEITRLKSEHQT